MKNTINLKKLLLFIVLFIIIIIILNSVLTYNMNQRVRISLDYGVEQLETHYKILLNQEKIVSNAIFKDTISIKMVKETLTEVLNTTDKEQISLLREKLRKRLMPLYDVIKITGVLQYHFILPNNHSFLRFHKPSKFDDDLTKVRNDVVFVNRYKKIVRGFHGGRVSHGFRNIFPIFGKDNIYLGALDISFGSKGLQKHFIKISKLHTHFLVNKKIFDTTFDIGKDSSLGYIQSIEDKNYMTSLSESCKKHISKKQKKMKLPSIKNKISKGKKFGIYIKYNGKIKNISFLPIKSSINKEVIAWLVSYKNDTFIESTLKIKKTVQFILFIVLLFLFLLFYKTTTQSYLIKENAKILEKKIEKRTKELLDTTLKQEQMLSLFNKGDIALIKWDYNENWNVEYISDGTKKLLGYSKDDLLNKNILYTSIIDKRDVDTTVKELMDAIAQKLDFFTHKPYRIITKESKTKWVMNSTLILKDKDNKIIGFLGYISDITSFKELEIENSKQKDLLQQQSKLAMMGEMIGAIAHQWRQPLNELSISIQMLKYISTEKLLDDNFIEDFIDKNKNTINFMSETIDDFRNFFKIDKKREKFSVMEAINSTISIVSSQLKNNNITLTVTGKNFTINSFRGEFQQVILNIVNNSKDALIENNIKNKRIEIILKNKLSNKYIKSLNSSHIFKEKKFVIIKDNGGGISNNIINRVFEPYFTTKEQGKGTGIGLYMSKMIIENNMDGTLDVSSHNNNTEFIIAL